MNEFLEKMVLDNPVKSYLIVAGVISWLFVLAHESRFTQSLPIETVSEEELLEQVDSYLGGSDESPLVSEPQDVELGRVD